MKKDILKKIWPEAGAIIFFCLLALAYFFIPVSQGLVLSGGDNNAGIGLGQEIAHHQAETGEMTRWTNAIFGGMPTYQIAPTYSSRSTLSTLRAIYGLGLEGALMYVFILLLGFYILLRILRIKPLTAVLGAICWAFSSYFFIIIGAGHIWKVLTLAFVPPTIGGMILCYRGKYLWGGIVTALFMAFQILSNHLQMTYYFGFLMILMLAGYFIQAIRKKEMKRFLKATLTMAIAGVIALAANLPSLYHTYQYSKESMRGVASIASAATPQKDGLSKDYITQWSYGIDETWTLLIPNAKGGASIPLAYNEKAMEKADAQFAQVFQQIGQYWGNQPGTSGPVYVGAFIMMLFFLSFFILKGTMKWCLLTATILSILLSWGHNFMDLTDFFIDNIPMYNKFRTVASILVIAEFTIPLMAIMALAKITDKPELLRKNNNGLLVSFVLTGGTALLFALFPTTFFDSFLSKAEAEQFGQIFKDNQEVGAAIMSNLSTMRQYIFTTDAWRSFFIILIGTIILFVYKKGIIKSNLMIFAITILCTIDMFAVNKRYLNNNNFSEKSVQEQSFAKTEADETILKDNDPDFRVLNFTKSTFNENETAYYHKSIGGYHPAKLGRYQDLINYGIAPEMELFRDSINKMQGRFFQMDFSFIPVLNMLNTKYFILPTSVGAMALPNPGTYGNAWFVNSIKFTSTPSEEMQTLLSINPQQEAVADMKFKDILKTTSIAVDSLSKVRLVSYSPNELQYDINSKTGGIAVFSEIYYPGWEATLDGKHIALGRADYILRAASIPAGKHQLKMEFRPASIDITETIAYIAIVLLLTGIAAAIFFYFKRQN